MKLALNENSNSRINAKNNNTQILIQEMVLSPRNTNATVFIPQPTTLKEG